jgi:competence protein ComEC
MVPVATALGVGILADHWFPVPLGSWMVFAAVSASAWGIVAWRGWATRRSAGLLLVWIACLGAARHHLFWSIAAPNDLSLFADDEPRLVRLQATLADQPEIISPPTSAARFAWMHHDTSAATLRCSRLLAGATDLPVSGKAALRVSGHLLHVDVGDEIEVCGWLMRPQPARNPDGFDAADFMRRQGIGCLITADHPDAVRRIRQGSGLSLWRWAARLRAQGEVLFNRDLTPRNAPVAAALLFGSRARMDEEIRDAFTQSGTLHVLAISGTHVAILAVLLWGLCRLLGLSVRATSLAMIAGVVGYTLLTDCRPPVIRATLLVCLFGSTRMLVRRPALSNGLAVAAIGILLWNPTDLFDVGAQLSFLGVLAVLWAARQIGERRHLETVRAVLLRDTKPTPFESTTKFLWTALWDGWRISVAAALFTMPLIAARFHMVSPISVVVNVVLAPFSTLLLWAGYLHTGIGLLTPWASRVFAVPFDWLLSCFLGIVETAAHVRLSHAYVPGPPEWWLAGYYALLLTVAFVRPVCRWGLRRWSMLAAWMIVGLAWGLRTPAPHELRCSFLSVGHGGAILVETPGGRTLLYDAGAMQDARVAQRAVQSTLWDRRYAGIDAIVISHADVDHFNGVVGLMETVPVGRVFVSQQFLDFRQPAVKSMCDSSAACGVPIKLIHEGDRLRLDDGPAQPGEDRVAITVLHPPPGHPHSDDNANSIVLLIEYAKRRILLTGDLDGSGQRALLHKPACDVDVLLAPHHGSRKANPAALADWAKPEQVIVSADRHVDFKSLRSAYGPDAEILSTHEFGAVTFEIRADGSMQRTTIRAGKKTRELSAVP